jgi:uncharacterized protein YkwD
MKTPLQWNWRGVFCLGGGTSGNYGGCTKSQQKFSGKKITGIPVSKMKGPTHLASIMLFMDAVKIIAISLLLAFASLSASAGEFNQKVLAEINLARTNPQGYAQLLAARMGSDNDRSVSEAIQFLQKAHPLPPLAPSLGLEQGAQAHVATQGPAGASGHGANPFGRIERFGQWTGSAGENIYYGSRDPRGVVCALIVDRGVSNRGHRRNIFSSSFGVAGVASGFHATYGSMCVIDFAGGFVERGGTLAGL